jgi:hypothetical protein
VRATEPLPLAGGGWEGVDSASNEGTPSPSLHMRQLNTGLGKKAPVECARRACIETKRLCKTRSRDLDTSSSVDYSTDGHWP